MLLDELRKLQAMISALAAATSEEAIADVVVDLLLPAVGADAGVMALSDDQGGLLVRRAVGYEGEPAGWRRISLDAGLPLTEAARRGEPVFLTTGAARLKAFPASAAIPVQYEGLVALPMVVAGRSVGVLA